MPQHSNTVVEMFQCVAMGDRYWNDKKKKKCGKNWRGKSSSLLAGALYKPL